ncbi:MAG: type II secretion system F family protein [Elusimicrobia bacterium]|nr:type II secretion system F family protein [Elusimicrobiota bacterium]
MARFKFRSMDIRGQICEGTASAQNIAALTELLKQQNQFMISAQPVAEKAAPVAAKTPLPLTARAARPGRRRRVGDVDVAVFNNQFGLMVRAAVPILDALTTAAKQQSNPAMRDVILDVAETVKGGGSLSAAFGRHPRVFDEVYMSLIGAGEASGTLSKMLERIGAYLDFRLTVRSRIRSAMIYPSVVMGTAFLVVVGLVVFVLPTFSEVFAQFDAELPPMTKFLLWVSASLRGHWALWLGAAASAAYGVRAYVTAERNRLAMHTLALSLPVVGDVVKAIVIARTTRVLGELLSAGVPILKCLDLTAAAAGNVVIAGVVRRMREQAEAGQPLWGALGASDHIPDMVAHLVAGAEKSGRLPDALSFIADYYQREIDAALAGLFAALEPVFVVFLGLTIGGIASAMLVPIFKLGGIVQ